MTSSFKRVPLGEVCEIVSSKRIFASEYKKEGVPFYRGKEISQLARGEKTTAELYISQDVYQGALSRSGPINAGDILLTAVGTLGNPYQVKEADLPFYFKDGNVLWLRSFSDDLNPTFLFYWLNSSFGRARILDTSIGSTQAALTISALSKVEILLPSRSQQDGVVETLTLLDKKIRVNHGISNSLKDIAQSIFKSWFVDFNPVKAKMLGQKPVGMDDETASLFPDSFIESELGMIPSTWRVTGLEEVATVKYGAPFASKHFNSVGVGTPLIRIRDLRKQSIATWTTEVHAKGFQVTGGDLLLGMDGEFNPTLWFGEDAWVNQRICKIEPKSFVSNFFTYFKLIPVMRRIEHGSTGSTVIHLGKSDLDSIMLSVPTQEISAKFKELLSPLLSELTNLQKQNRILWEIRERMLPRLVSGELVIPEDMMAS